MPARPVLAPLAAVLAAALATTPAHAQLLVYDPAAVVQLVDQARTALAQLERLGAQVDEAQKLYASLNDLSDVNGLAVTLLGPELKRVLPELDALAGLQQDLQGLGDLAERARQIRAEARLLAPGAAADALLEAVGDRAARDLAISEEIAKAADQRQDGLDELRASLGDAGSARAVIDLEARLAAEQALIANDQMRLQGAQMMQAAEARLDEQRRRERAVARTEALADFFQRGIAHR